jgi:arsenite-transporting ATPase
LRIILYTGKGGVGKTSVAAATVLKAARAGKRVLVMSTDPAHSVSDAFDVEVGPEPKEIARGLYAQEMDQGAMLEEYWAEIREYATTFFEWQGASSLTQRSSRCCQGWTSSSVYSGSDAITTRVGTTP